MTTMSFYFSRKKVPEVMPRVINSIVMLLNDESLPVQKKVIQVSGIIYKHALEYIAHHGSSNELNNLWDLLTRVKTSIIDLVDGDNDGYVTIVITIGLVSGRITQKASQFSEEFSIIP